MTDKVSSWHYEAHFVAELGVGRLLQQSEVRIEVIYGLGENPGEVD